MHYSSAVVSCTTVARCAAHQITLGMEARMSWAWTQGDWIGERSHPDFALRRYDNHFAHAGIVTSDVLNRQCTHIFNFYLNPFSVSPSSGPYVLEILYPTVFTLALNSVNVNLGTSNCVSRHTLPQGECVHYEHIKQSGSCTAYIGGN